LAVSLHGLDSIDDFFPTVTISSHKSFSFSEVSVHTVMAHLNVSDAGAELVAEVIAFPFYICDQILENHPFGHMENYLWKTQLKISVIF